jgi:hypothetical protein
MRPVRQLWTTARIALGLIANWFRIWRVRGSVAVVLITIALVIGAVIGYGVAEWNFAHDCNDLMFTATRFEDGMEPFIDHPDDRSTENRLRLLHRQYAIDFAHCRDTFLIR